MSTLLSDGAMTELLSDTFVSHLRNLATDKAAEYRASQPFPHTYFDNFLPADVAAAALHDFPGPRELPWNEFAGKDEVKLAFDSVEKLPASIRDILFFFSSRPMLEFLEGLTGIEGLIPDPYFTGGGLHQIKPGGFLEVHADFNRHKKLKLDRRLNVLLYLNRDWQEEYGGHFELWNQEMSAPVKKILPIFNRCAMFSTSSTSFHGHPTPLTCPRGQTRKSIAVYYYSNGRPEKEVREAHNTLFQQRAGARHFHLAGLKKAIRAVTPPILMDAVTRNRHPGASR